MCGGERVGAADVLLTEVVRMALLCVDWREGPGRLGMTGRAATAVSVYVCVFLLVDSQRCDGQCMHKPAAISSSSSYSFSSFSFTNRRSDGQLVPVMLELAYSRAQPTITYTANDPPAIWQVCVCVSVNVYVYVHTHFL